jgi:hypothetical protein
MRGVFFQDRTGRVARSPYRTDVALLVGFVERRPGELPDGLARWLDVEGWSRGRPEAEVRELLDLPVPVDRFETFDRLFAWDRRPVGGAGSGDRLADTYLGAAVRSFFAQGGRLCYVVRAGSPSPVPLTPAESRATELERDARLALLIPGSTGAMVGSPVERATWRGVWTLYGLPDVSMVCVPDLPDVVRTHFDEDANLPAAPIGPVGFVECAEPGGRNPDSWLRSLHPPTCDDAGYRAWARALNVLTAEVELPRAAGSLREVQVIAAVPRPDDRLEVRDFKKHLDEIDDSNGRTVGLSTDLEARGLESAFLQLVYPWLTTELSHRLPGDLVPPDAVIAGVIARGALERGCYRSVGGQEVLGVIGQTPRLTRRELDDPADVETLGARVSLIGPTPAGNRVLSDVTTSLEGTFRLAHANRTVSAIVRVLRTIGEEQAFAPSNEATWSGLRARISDVLREFWLDGALRGGSAAEAFSVRCDRSTMTQDDLDAGRLVVVVEIAVAVAIQRINVVLTRTGDTVTLERAA